MDLASNLRRLTAPTGVLGLELKTTMISRNHTLRQQRGFVEIGLIMAIIAVILVGVVIYVKHRRNTQALVSRTATSQTSTTTSTPAATKDPTLDSSAADANSSVNQLNSSYNTDASSGNLNATQPSIQ